MCPQIAEGIQKGKDGFATFSKSLSYSMNHSKQITRFSIECRNTKAKITTIANRKYVKYHKEPMKTQSKKSTLSEAQENGSHKNALL